jgi:hypothetical protein
MSIYRCSTSLANTTLGRKEPWLGPIISILNHEVRIGDALTEAVNHQIYLTLRVQSRYRCFQ